MEEYKLLVVFDFKNGEYTMAEYDKLKDIAIKHDTDINDLLMDITKSLGADGYTLMSSRLLN